LAKLNLVERRHICVEMALFQLMHHSGEWPRSNTRVVSNLETAHAYGSAA
jgi:hypothetical protein